MVDVLCNLNPKGGALITQLCAGTYTLRVLLGRVQKPVLSCQLHLDSVIQCLVSRCVALSCQGWQHYQLTAAVISPCWLIVTRAYIEINSPELSPLLFLQPAYQFWKTVTCNISLLEILRQFSFSVPNPDRYSWFVKSLASNSLSFR